ncbi:hypothetical protein [Fictibacillus sp. 18YEL24]|uniref:hypothetical protein n=1 Tax=Fictibacillus sp. 18YEL24 TaxID=2745875 RepID=UPI0018CED49D|nr:hypothetical protein [Fictibacillus sp. 18YEL24]MBH0168837.1 hypothetical protein [Fictibacillus sp. 18YEL24]
MAQSGRRLTVRPVESMQPGAEINYFQAQPFQKPYPSSDKTILIQHVSGKTEREKDK